MPDSLPVHGDTIIVDMIRKFAQERLAPHGGGAGEGGADRTRNHSRTRRTGRVRRHHAGGMGRQRNRSGHLRLAAGGNRGRRRLGFDHGVGA